MGRPREHDQHTAVALLEAAERLVSDEGVQSLSVRRVSDAVGTSTRAVYSLYGSKEGLVVALGIRAFDLLRFAIEALPRTENPARDLVNAGVTVFRRFALDHPALFQLAVQHREVPPDLVQGFRASAEHALAGLENRVTRLSALGLIGGRAVSDAVFEFHALCEGLAALELRGAMPQQEGERVWRDGLSALVAGWEAPQSSALGTPD